MSLKIETPESYGPDWSLVSLWLLLTGCPLPIAIFLVVRDGLRPDLEQMVLATAIPPLIVAIFAARFRATFNSESFAYRRWGPTIRVKYSDILRIEVTNVTPITKQAIGAFIVIKHGERLPFWPKLFPREAVNRFFEMGDQS